MKRIGWIFLLSYQRKSVYVLNKKINFSHALRLLLIKRLNASKYFSQPMITQSSQDKARKNSAFLSPAFSLYLFISIASSFSPLSMAV